MAAKQGEATESGQVPVDVRSEVGGETSIDESAVFGVEGVEAVEGAEGRRAKGPPPLPSRSRLGTSRPPPPAGRAATTPSVPVAAGLPRSSAPPPAESGRRSSAPGGPSGAASSLPPPPPPPLPKDVVTLRSQLQKANSRSHELLCERVRLERLLLARDGELRALRLELQAVRASSSAPNPTTSTNSTDATHSAEPDGELERLRERVAALEAQLAASPDATGPSLANISGVGPTFQKRLGDLGVDLAALATWTDADIARFAAEIGTQPGRIRRQGWVTQAQALISDA